MFQYNDSDKSLPSPLKLMLTRSAGAFDKL